MKLHLFSEAQIYFKAMELIVQKLNMIKQASTYFHHSDIIMVP